MPNLHSLPNELILSIASHVPPPALHSLALTNRRLHALTLSSLYFSFSSQYRNFSPQNAALLLRTVASSARKANFVKHIHWAADVYVASQPRSHTPAVRDFVQRRERFASLAPDRLLEAVCRAGEYEPTSVPMSERWFLEFFLSFVPGVTELQVGGAWLWDDDVYWFTSGGFRFEKVVLKGPLRVENVVPLLHLPTLRVLWLTEVVELRRESGVVFPWEKAETRIEYPAGTCRVEDLSMSESYISSEKLVKVLDAITALRCFKYDHQETELVAEDEEVRIDYAALARALERHKESLARLCFADDGGESLTDVADIASWGKMGLVRH
ncbi:hypothetical protein HBI56_176130 [Parastagonospora nodorum]|nr:hypothetical protein HBH51_181230 [Parastagonospora nodorum]KAH3993407.1 hypothetical protein HBI10_203460 [Parastagonospora nodorum]KAH4011632.1 hypothetical protein HBI13_194800 [Parastagonospora nodorum]KAH4101098.1 hypothetical protein HBH46_142610 [Parastagonospora nodorum]KAH4118188.1 hypothetical protein HBH47_145310 [Parastagonospora nodorum]